MCDGKLAKRTTAPSAIFDAIDTIDTIGTIAIYSHFYRIVKVGFVTENAKNADFPKAGK